MCLRLELGNFPIEPSVYMLYLKDCIYTCCYVALCVLNYAANITAHTLTQSCIFFSINFVWKIMSFFFCPRF